MCNVCRLMVRIGCRITPNMIRWYKVHFVRFSKPSTFRYDNQDIFLSSSLACLSKPTTSIRNSTLEQPSLCHVKPAQAKWPNLKPWMESWWCFCLERNLKLRHMRNSVVGNISRLIHTRYSTGQLCPVFSIHRGIIRILSEFIFRFGRLYIYLSVL